MASLLSRAAGISFSSSAKVDAPSIGPLRRPVRAPLACGVAEAVGDAHAAQPAGDEGGPKTVAGAGRVELGPPGSRENGCPVPVVITGTLGAALDDDAGDPQIRIIAAIASASVFAPVRRAVPARSAGTMSQCRQHEIDERARSSGSARHLLADCWDRRRRCRRAPSPLDRLLGITRCTADENSDVPMT